MVSSRILSSDWSALLAHYFAEVHWGIANCFSPQFPYTTLAMQFITLALLAALTSATDYFRLNLWKGDEEGPNLTLDERNLLLTSDMGNDQDDGKGNGIAKFFRKDGKFYAQSYSTFQAQLWKKKNSHIYYLTMTPEDWKFVHSAIPSHEWGAEAVLHSSEVDENGILSIYLVEGPDRTLLKCVLGDDENIKFSTAPLEGTEVYNYLKLSKLP